MIGDLVRIKDCGPEIAAGDVWHEFMGEFGVIICEADRVYIPAAKVFVNGIVAEFDLEELEEFNEEV